MIPKDEAASIWRRLNALAQRKGTPTCAIQTVAKARPRTAKTKALEMVAQEIADSIARCEDLESKVKPKVMR